MVFFSYSYANAAYLAARAHVRLCVFVVGVVVEIIPNDLARESDLSRSTLTTLIVRVHFILTHPFSSRINFCIFLVVVNVVVVVVVDDDVLVFEFFYSRAQTDRRTYIRERNKQNVKRKEKIEKKKLFASKKFSFSFFFFLTREEKS